MEFKKPRKNGQAPPVPTQPQQPTSAHAFLRSSTTSEQPNFLSSQLNNLASSSTKKRIIFSSVVVVVAVFLIIGVLSHQQNTAKKITATADPAKTTETFEKETVVPNGKPIEALGGWKRVSPPNSAPVFAYTDAIDGVAITVSQQILPDSFKSDTDSKVAELAQKFSATTKINAGNTKVYLGSSSKGPQSVIFTKGKMLILIKSQKQISNPSWMRYITSLG